MTNPYAAPSAEIGKTGKPTSKEQAFHFDEIIRRWEWLRLVYNAFLVVVVLLLTFASFPILLDDVGFWFCVVFGAFTANLCFFTGPAIEGYGTHFGWWHPAFTIVLFLGGLGLATILAAVSIASYAQWLAAA